ncbi:MAG: HAD hydrolase family protein [Nakamurella sp.]
MSWIRAIAVDLDGTIATDDVIAPEVLDAIKHAQYRGVRMLLVTGRTIAALRTGFPGPIEDFDAVVAENGGVLMVDGRHRLLADPVNPSLIQALLGQGIPLQQGEVLVGLSADHDVAALHEITRLGLDSTLLRNRGQLMILPTGVSKGAGLLIALAGFGLSAHNTLAVGDAENDHSMFEIAELAAAPPNALPAVKDHADLILQAANGQGVAALLTGQLVAGEIRPHSARRQIRIGECSDGSDAQVSTIASTILLVGGSGRGKSYLAGVVAEQLIDHAYQILVIDPEGEQAGLAATAGVTSITVKGEADITQAVETIRAGSSVVLDLSSTERCQQSALLSVLATPILALRAETGAPQWVIIDEAHELAGPTGPLRALFDPTAGGHCLVTYHPEQLSAEVLNSADVIISASPPIDQVLGTVNVSAAGLPKAVTGQAMLMRTDRAEAGQPFMVATRITKHQRHQRKYAELCLPTGRGFRFRPFQGHQLPEARTIDQFSAQLDQIDPDTLGWHMQRGDLSKWLCEVVQDRQLGDHVAQLERDLTLRQLAEVQRAKEELATAIADRYIG